MNKVKYIAILNMILTVVGIVIVVIKPFANSLWWGVGIISVCYITALVLYVIHFSSISSSDKKK